MKKNHSIELAQSVLFFTVVWIVAQYVRGEIFKQLEGFVEGAGKIGGLVFALGIAVLKFYSWRKSLDAEGFAVRLWNAFPWFLGIALPAVYVVTYFVTDENVGVMDWISLMTELVVPVAALIVAYFLLSQELAEQEDRPPDPPQLSMDTKTNRAEGRSGE